MYSMLVSNLILNVAHTCCHILIFNPGYLKAPARETTSSVVPVAGISPTSAQHLCSGLRLCYAICGEKAEWCDKVGGLDGWLSDDTCAISKCPPWSAIQRANEPVTESLHQSEMASTSSISGDNTEPDTPQLQAQNIYYLFMEHLLIVSPTFSDPQPILCWIANCSKWVNLVCPILPSCRPDHSYPWFFPQGYYCLERVSTTQLASSTDQ